MSDQRNGGTARIAIKFGTSSTTTNSKKSSRPNPPSALGKRPRSNAWGAGSESEPDDDEHEKYGRHERITRFGANGAETERKSKHAKTEKKDYVIARQPNRDWKSEVKAQRTGENLLPKEARQQQQRQQKNGSTVEMEPADQDKRLKWGLTLKEKPAREEQEAEAKPSDDDAPPNNKDSKEPPPAPRTADDEAIDALLGKKTEEEKVIHPSEEDAFKRDVQRAGEASTLEDYEAMPVEEFGAALLRGMGWDGKPRGARVKEVKRRPNRLGLGAKELKEDENLGAWNQGGGNKNKNRRPRLNEYRREEDKRKESRRHEGSYKQERERERDRYGHRDRERERDQHWDSDRHRDRHRDYDRHRR